MRALERASELLISIVGGDVGPVSLVADLNLESKSKQVELRPARIERILGASIPNEMVEAILGRLELSYAG